MSLPGAGTDLECRCTRCKFNNNGECGYQGRVRINQNGECETMETGFEGPPGPHGTPREP